MAIKPLIGINLDFQPAGRFAGAQLRIHEGYAARVRAAGGTPIFLPPCLPSEVDEGLFEYLDGFILAGSPWSIDAKLIIGQTHSACCSLYSDLKWNFDSFLIKKIMEYNFPVLAIANGLLHLNLLSGGKLYCHLPEDLPKALPHKDVTGGPHRHAVNLVPGTTLDKIYSGGQIRVNSYHHQAIKAPGNRLRVAAIALDGVIEAVESADPEWTCLGLQWHPHSETASAMDAEVFNYFVHQTDRFRDGEYGVKRKLKSKI